jgi:hypothetical protein
MRNFSEKWDVEKKKDINLLVTEEQKKEILLKIGYSINSDGFLIDKKTNEKIKAEDGLEINIKTDKNFALIGGSHNFVRNLASFSQLLANKNALNLEAKKE